MSKQSAASKVRDIASKFLEENIGKEFKRKELEDYIDQRIELTAGEKTGGLNRLLIEKGKENGILQLGRGVYLYDPTQIESDTLDGSSITGELQKIMDEAFDKAKAIINSIQIVDVLTEDDLDQLTKYRELLKIQSKINEILGTFKEEK